MSSSFPQRVLAAVRTVDPRAKLAWESQGYGKVTLSPGGHVVVMPRRAFVPEDVCLCYGHGCSRLPSHPEYPSPISSSFIMSLKVALSTVNPA